VGGVQGEIVGLARMGATAVTAVVASVGQALDDEVTAGIEAAHVHVP